MGDRKHAWKDRRAEPLQEIKAGAESSKGKRRGADNLGVGQVRTERKTAQRILPRCAAFDGTKKGAKDDEEHIYGDKRPGIPTHVRKHVRFLYGG